MTRASLSLQILAWTYINNSLYSTKLSEAAICVNPLALYSALMLAKLKITSRSSTEFKAISWKCYNTLSSLLSQSFLVQRITTISSWHTMATSRPTCKYLVIFSLQYIALLKQHYHIGPAMRSSLDCLCRVSCDSNWAHLYVKPKKHSHLIYYLLLFQHTMCTFNVGKHDLDLVNLCIYVPSFFLRHYPF